MNNLTVIYYSSNQEDPAFENKIVDNLKKQVVDIPIISVTHKPMDLGKNICIDEQIVCYSNLWKQQLIGLKEAKTKFCVTAEADCLYPPDYFQFVPPKDNLVYRYGNVWAYWKYKNKTFYRKPRCEGAQICGREFWIERLEEIIDWHKGWNPMKEHPGRIVSKIFTVEDRYLFTGDPVITFITGQGIGTKTSLLKTEPQKVLPYWGVAQSLYEEMFLCT